MANKEALDLQNKNYDVAIEVSQNTTNETVYASEQQIQKLTEEDIKNLTLEEKNPEKIIEALLKNNANFEKRSEFSKQKYMEKKNKKYNLILKIEKCDLQNLNRLFVTDRKDYIFAREDYLAFLLNHVHPKNGDNVFIVEKTRGVVLSAFLEKISQFDESRIYFTHPKMNFGDITKFEAVKLLNQSDNFKQKTVFVKNDELIQINVSLNFLVIAYDEMETNFLEKLEGFMDFNAKIVVFTNFYESATKVYEYLVAKKHFVNVLFNDYMFREMQAWPMRSHATMMGNTSAGYFVSAINVNIVEK